MLLSMNTGITPDSHVFVAAGEEYSLTNDCKTKLKTRITSWCIVKNVLDHTKIILLHLLLLLLLLLLLSFIYSFFIFVFHSEYSER